MNSISYEIFLKLSKGVAGVIDTSKKIIEQANGSDNFEITNVSYHEFINRFVEWQDIDIKSFDLNYFITWAMNNRGNRDIVLSAQKNSGEKVKYNVSLVDGEEPNKRFFLLTSFSRSEDAFYLYDDLTYVYTKSSIESIVKEELNSKNPRPFSLIIVDIDDFKSVNDTYGHKYGDEVLVAAAHKFKEVFPTGIIGRIGGDEFMIIDYGDTSYESIHKRLHDSLYEFKNDFVFGKDLAQPFTLGVVKNDTSNVQITITCGVSRCFIDGIDYDTLFTKADKALYRGKRKGKNCFIIYMDEKHKNIDMSMLKKIDVQEERSRASFQNILNNSLGLLVRNYSNELNLKAFLNLYGEFLLVDRILVYMFEQDKQKLVGSYINQSVYEADIIFLNETGKEPEDTRVISQDYLLKRQNISNIATKNSALYKYYTTQNVKSMLRLPISFNGNNLGYVRIDMCKAERFWTTEDVNIAKMLAQILSIYLYRSNEAILLKSMLSTDQLTGLNNATTGFNLANERLTFELKPFVVGYIDIKNFKYYNDVFGYECGDKILKLLAFCITDVYSNAIISRLSSDHFFVMYEYKNNEEIEILFKALVSKFEQNCQMLKMNNEIDILAGFYITDGTENNISGAIDKARIALYSRPIKGSGYRLYGRKMYDEHQRSQAIEHNFLKALANNEFEIYLQPKINPYDGKLVGAEALSRWNSRTDGFLLPASYIPILEDKGLISDLDLFVFEEVCKYLRQRINANKKVVPISVNVSKAQTNFDEYFNKLEEIRKRYNIKTSLIEIEFTEAAIVNSEKAMNELMRKFKAVGYRLAIDDFGAGFSNLDLISNENFNIVKLDKTLVDNSTNQRKLLTIVYVIALAKKLKLEVVCEGVETNAQLEIVKSAGCDVIQGFYYSEPLKLEDFNNKYGGE